MNYNILTATEQMKKDPPSLQRTNKTYIYVYDYVSLTLYRSRDKLNQTNERIVFD
jgi:hypothetical protein